MGEATEFGRVFGYVLDCHNDGGSGRASLRRERAHAPTQAIMVRWRNASVWHLDLERLLVVSDGVVTQSWVDGDPKERTPTRAGHPAYELMTVFPLRAHVWGRIGDDFYPASCRRQGHDAVVTLAGTEDDRRGEMTVDVPRGFLRELVLSHERWTVIDYAREPQEDEWFTTTRG